MRIKRILVLLFILALSLAVFLYRADSVAIIEPLVGTKVGGILLEIKNKAHSANEAVQNKIKDTVEVFLPRTEETQNTSQTKTQEPTPPAVPETTKPQTNENTNVSEQLTVVGTISQTNQYRQQQGLSQLLQNSRLTLSAQMKINDMFAGQYFEHESPSGIGSDDLARSVGYAYLMIGENLALGDYESDFELVEGWMNSPGHRENILNSKYTEIGVAIKKGLFNGEAVWLAVQEFGRPTSDCPEVSITLNNQIEASQQLLSELEQKLSDMLDDIEATKPTRGSVYTQKVDVYNTLVHQYNVFVEQSKNDVATYNAQVKAHNTCVQE
ncbi:MAG: CAP domain-containing protein [Candidatus Campbellbacteria bacterium]|nr:CAP domain-containing protein [Candidatus Campbellbacteria bacterium]